MLKLIEQAEIVREEAGKLEFASPEASELLKELAGLTQNLVELVVTQEKRLRALEKKK